MSQLASLKGDLAIKANPEKAAFFPRFFKTGPGDYGEGDLFLGITVPDCRNIARSYKDLPLPETIELLHSKWHEERLVALLIMVLVFQRGSKKTQQEIYEQYLANTTFINNWDLVDTSARDIVGQYIYEHSEELAKLDKLANSKLLWGRRISIIATFYFLQKGDPAPTLHIAEKLLSDKYDLIQKAVGWMLREMGKRVDQQLLLDFIAQHHSTMPRTTLRYAIEKFSPETRRKLLAGIFH
jgi:3-methyladenine DNA glycosylase AlkD